jgi:hypothetical protein
LQNRREVNDGSDWIFAKYGNDGVGIGDVAGLNFRILPSRALVNPVEWDMRLPKTSTDMPPDKSGSSGHQHNALAIHEQLLYRKQRRP